MKKTIIIFFTVILFSCSQKTELDFIVEKKPELKVFVDSLKIQSAFYKRCQECNLIGYAGEELIGYTNRYPPKGNYDRKEIKIGMFEYDTYFILDSENDERTNGKIYFCYFSKEQKIKFENFIRYYENLIMHGKSTPIVKYIGNVAIITVE